VVAINRFGFDSERELDLVRSIALKSGAMDAQVSEVWEHGGRGGEALARAVVAAAESGSGSPRYLYSDETSIKDKLSAICREMYGANGVVYLPEAERQIRTYTANGWDKMPICMAKTQYSLSDNAALKGRPSGFDVTIREIRAYTGAGFLTPISGEIMTMPGLPSNAAYQSIDLEENGDIVGLF
jgi:formyltetrahydrofolate synthetase